MSQHLDQFKEKNPNNLLDPGPNETLGLHDSPETAVAVTDYPYGRRLRCIMRYWLEWKKGKGYRLMQQTNDPRYRDLFWNKPKASTYNDGVTALYTNAEGHVKTAELNGYSLWCGTIAEAEAVLMKIDAFVETYHIDNARDMEWITRARDRMVTKLVGYRTPHLKLPAPNKERREGHVVHISIMVCHVCGETIERCTGQYEVRAVKLVQTGDGHCNYEQCAEDDPAAVFTLHKYNAKGLPEHVADFLSRGDAESLDTSKAIADGVAERLAKLASQADEDDTGNPHDRDIHDASCNGMSPCDMVTDEAEDAYVKLSDAEGAGMAWAIAS